MSPLALALGFAPVLLLLAGMLAMDCYKLVSRRALVQSVLWGAVAAALAWGLNGIALDGLGVPSNVVRHWIAPVLEEALKLAWIIGLVRRGRVGFLVDAGIHGFAIGTGFAVTENLYYANALADSSLLLWIVRGLGTAIMHGGATAIAAILARDRTERRTTSLRSFAPGFAIAVSMHALFNQLPFSPLVATSCVILVVPIVLIVAYELSERQTRDWLGESMDREVEILDLVRSGRISETHVGLYLLELQRRFPGTVVADMLCLLEIQATLAMMAKGMLIARGAGVELPPDPEAAAHIREMRYLERSIGPTGMLAIMPFLKLGTRGRWQIRMLEQWTQGA